MVTLEEKRRAWKDDHNTCDACGNGSVSRLWSSHELFREFHFCSFTCMAMGGQNSHFLSGIFLPFVFTIAFWLGSEGNIFVAFLGTLIFGIPMWFIAGYGYIRREKFEQEFYSRNPPKPENNQSDSSSHWAINQPRD